MRITVSVLLNFFAFMIPALSLSDTPPVPSYLNITTTFAANGQSTLECWQLSSPFAQSGTPGTSGASTAQLGETGMSSFTLIPSGFDGGLHNAPAVQFVVFLSGLAIVSLPNSTDTATIYGGRNGMVLAADTKNVSKLGHMTVYPSKQETVALQVPTRNNEIPEHTVIHGGPCSWEEMT